jgi:hypothetical protein
MGDWAAAGAGAQLGGDGEGRGIDDGDHAAVAGLAFDRAVVE